MNPTLHNPVPNIAVADVAARLRRWLDSPTWTTSEVADWCLGYALPAVGHDEPPYIWILRGLPSPNQRRPYERELGRRLAALLAEGVQGRTSSSREVERLYYNLFEICAGIGARDELAESLFQFEQAQRQFAADQQLGSLARVAFCDALIRNQVDSRMSPVWLGVLAGERDTLLPGDHYTGFHGVRLMPASKETRGEPAMDQIGLALRCMADQLGDLGDRRPKFREVLSLAIGTYPDHPRWKADLIEQADQHAWPLWAADCLPSHFARASDSTWYVSTRYLPLLRIDEGQVRRVLCADGLIGEFEIACERLNPIVDSIIEQLEVVRLSVPWPSDGAVCGVLATESQSLMLSLPKVYEGNSEDDGIAPWSEEDRLTAKSLRGYACGAGYLALRI